MLSWRQDVDITLARDADVRELVDLRVFNGLQPGTTIEQARSQIGAPARAWSDDSGTWREYRNEWGTPRKMTPRANDRTITLWRRDHTAIVGAFLERERITRMHLLAHVR